MKIAIQHILANSGDGGPSVAYSELSAQEIADLREFIYFRVHWDPDASEAVKKSRAKIISIEFIYDGIADNLGILKNEEFDCIKGDPAPVICYELDGDVDEEEFKRCIWTSSMVFLPASRKKTDEEPYLAEDQNGKTKIVNHDIWHTIAEDNGILSSKMYNFPEGIPSGEGPTLPAVEFANVQE